MSRVNIDGVARLHRLGTVELRLSTRSPSRPTTSSAPQEDEVFSRTLEEQTIDQIDAAQLAGSLPRSFKERVTPLVAVHVSKLGVKFIDPDTSRCLDRLAMHNVIDCMAYDADHDDLINVAILVQNKGGNAGIAHVFQTLDPDEATLLCQHCDKAFDLLDEEARSRVQEKQQRRSQIRKDREKKALLSPISPEIASEASSQ